MVLENFENFAPTSPLQKKGGGEGNGSITDIFDGTKSSIYRAKEAGNLILTRAGNLRI